MGPMWAHIAWLPGRSLASLDDAWKKVLLNQFHDVLPGSGISLVYEDATQLYQEAMVVAAALWQGSLETMFGTSPDTKGFLFNTLQWPRKQVVDIANLKQGHDDNNEHLRAPPVKEAHYDLVTVPAFGYKVVASVAPTNPVELEANEKGFILSNGLVRAVISSSGQVTSLTANGDSSRDVFVRADGTQLRGNKLLLFDDQPLYWDAWDVMDYHLETEQTLNNVGVSTPATIADNSIFRGSLSWGCNIGKGSTLIQEISLTADCPYITFITTVNWAENRKLLKVGFDTCLKSKEATYDCQFGSLKRPTTVNTSWDSARYEVCGHKYADLSEPDWGVSVLNNSKYGWSGRDSSLTLTLLKSPKAPDDGCDMGEHRFSYALLPHHGSVNDSGVIQHSYEFNNPLKYELLPASTADSKSWCSVVGDGVVLHTVKPAEDGSGDIVLRVYESHGTRTKASLEIALPLTTVESCDGMEENKKTIGFSQAGGITTIPLSMTPFAIYAVRLGLQRSRK